MRVLALDAALGRCSAGIVVDDEVVAERMAEGLRAHARLAPMVEEVCRLAGAPPELVAVTTGPGSFTGLRAALALAHGFALGAGIRVVGVSVAEALADALPRLGPRALWVAIDNRRGGVFLGIGGEFASVRVSEMDAPDGPVAIAGDAAIACAASLAARGHDVMLTDARLPLPRHVAVVARLRAQGRLAPAPALPVYVDAPAAALPRQRPLPTGTAPPA